MEVRPHLGCRVKDVGLGLSVNDRFRVGILKMLLRF